MELELMTAEAQKPGEGAARVAFAFETVDVTPSDGAGDHGAACELRAHGQDRRRDRWANRGETLRNPDDGPAAHACELGNVSRAETVRRERGEVLTSGCGVNGE